MPTSLPRQLSALLEAPDAAARNGAWTAFLNEYSKLLLRTARRASSSYDEEQRGPSTGVSGGISVIPTGEFEVVFEAEQERGIVRVLLTDEAELAVRATGAGPAYSVAPEQVRVANAGSTADYEILLPRSAHYVRIRVNDSVVFTKQEASIATVGVRDARGRYVLGVRRSSPAQPQLQTPERESPR